MGGSSNILVNDYGYCERKDTGKVCNEIGECGELMVMNNTLPTTNFQEFGDTLCSDQVLNDVASFNYYWLNIILITKCVGLLFLLLLECNTCLKRIDQKDKEAEEAQATEKCFKCKQWGKACCCATLIMVLKFFFIVFGTFATIIAI